MANGVGLLNLPPVLVPRAPATTQGDDFVAWAKSLTQAVETMRQGLDNLAEPYISATSQISGDLSITGELAAGSVRTEHIAAGAIVAGSISVTGAIITQALQVSDAIITNAKIVSLDGQKILASSITATQLAAGLITADKISTTGVIITQSAQISDAIITSAKIGDLQVGTAKLANLSVTNAKIADLSIDNAKIQDLAVSSAKIQNLAVDSAKIKDLSVTTLKVADSAVTSSKRQNVEVTFAPYVVLPFDTTIVPFYHGSLRIPLATCTTGNPEVIATIFFVNLINLEVLIFNRGGVIQNGTVTVYYW